MVVVYKAYRKCVVDNEVELQECSLRDHVYTT